MDCQWRKAAQRSGSEPGNLPGSWSVALFLRNFLSGPDGLSINCFTERRLQTTLAGQRHHGS
jgi:hypothetical protein